MVDMEAIAGRFAVLQPMLDERMRRAWAAAEAAVLGRGGITAVSTATGISRRAIHLAIREMRGEASERSGRRIRRPGGGRKRLVERDPTLATDLERLIEPLTRGDPESPLRWTCKSTRQLAAELGEQGHQVSYVTVGELLHELGYSLQANSKTIEGTAHADRNTQFEYLNSQVDTQLTAGEPVISVDTKKKELVGTFKNAGQEWRPSGDPQRVQVHDFPSPELGKVSPYGVYDLAHNAGWVSVGTDHDTAAFAVQSIRSWWHSMGRETYPRATSLLITADSGGSNGYRVRLWKLELQKLADDLQLPITVCHLPPGTSKWNKIEHRLFSFISQNWRAQPLVSHEAIVNLIAATTTTKGLQVRAELDRGTYPKGVQISDAEMHAINLYPHPTCKDWNYTIRPRQTV